MAPRSSVGHGVGVDHVADEWLGAFCGEGLEFFGGASDDSDFFAGGEQFFGGGCAGVSCGTDYGDHGGLLLVQIAGWLQALKPVRERI